MPSICQPYHIYLYTPHVHQDPMIPHMSQLGYSCHGGVSSGTYLAHRWCWSGNPAFFQATSSSRFGQRFGYSTCKIPGWVTPKMVVEGLGGNPSQHVRTNSGLGIIVVCPEKILVQVIFGILLPSYVEIEKKHFFNGSFDFVKLWRPHTTPKTPHIRGLVSGNIFWNFRGG